jgi:hypothetical protein
VTAPISGASDMEFAVHSTITSMSGDHVVWRVCKYNDESY